MKILHCCLSCFYIDHYAYQENLLPKYHKKAGHEVEILASTETYIDDVVLGYVQPDSYLNEDGIRVTRIPYKAFLPKKLARKLRAYESVEEFLNRSKPDIVFFHGPCAFELLTIARYVRENKGSRLIVDGHEDWNNSARSFVSKYILHGVIYKSIIAKTMNDVEVFWGTLPVRCAFLHEMYDIPNHKINLLVMGVDDDELDRVRAKKPGRHIRGDLGIGDNDVLLVTGGKFNRAKKGTIELIRAVKTLRSKGHKELRLLLFGTVEKSLELDFERELGESDAIMHVGWASVCESYDYFDAADLVVFPGSHSVYWEQATGLGKPLLIRRLDGISHLNMGGNLVFLDTSSEEEICLKIEKLLIDRTVLKEMTVVAQQSGPAHFSYSKIAERAIGLDV